MLLALKDSGGQSMDGGGGDSAKVPLAATLCQDRRYGLGCDGSRSIGDRAASPALGAKM
jgi:hypothetical protein